MHLHRLGVASENAIYNYEDDDWFKMVDFPHGKITSFTFASFAYSKIGVSTEDAIYKYEKREWSKITDFPHGKITGITYTGIVQYSQSVGQFKCIT